MALFILSAFKITCLQDSITKTKYKFLNSALSMDLTSDKDIHSSGNSTNGEYYFSY